MLVGTTTRSIRQGGAEIGDCVASGPSAAIKYTLLWQRVSDIIFRGVKKKRRQFVTIASVKLCAVDYAQWMKQ
jgi:hypothetical protein